jgi:hypothetical protein
MVACFEGGWEMDRRRVRRLQWEMCDYLLLLSVFVCLGSSFDIVSWQRATFDRGLTDNYISLFYGFSFDSRIRMRTTVFLGIFG